MAIVAFDYTAWVTRYPEFSSVNEALAQLYFNEAGLYCDNTVNSPVTDDSVGGLRYTLLLMLTSHICALNAAINGQAASSLVGRISRAGEGSVSVETQNDHPPGSAQWFQQTKYGAAFWSATVQYRTMRYICGSRRMMDPWGYRRW